MNIGPLVFLLVFAKVIPPGKHGRCAVDTKIDHTPQTYTYDLGFTPMDLRNL